MSLRSRLVVWVNEKADAEEYERKRRLLTTYANAGSNDAGYALYELKAKREAHLQIVDMYAQTVRESRQRRREELFKEVIDKCRFWRR